MPDPAAAPEADAAGAQFLVSTLLWAPGRLAFDPIGDSPAATLWRCLGLDDIVDAEPVTEGGRVLAGAADRLAPGDRPIPPFPAGAEDVVAEVRRVYTMQAGRDIHDGLFPELAAPALAGDLVGRRALRLRTQAPCPAMEGGPRRGGSGGRGLGGRSCSAVQGRREGLR